MRKRQACMRLCVWYAIYICKHGLTAFTIYQAGMSKSAEQMLTSIFNEHCYEALP